MNVRKRMKTRTKIKLVKGEEKEGMSSVSIEIRKWIRNYIYKNKKGKYIRVKSHFRTKKVKVKK